jgi:hypothetical protein
MNEKDIIELYRTQVEGNNVTPPDECWDEINTQLDLDDAWESIAVELDNVLPLNYDIKKVSPAKKPPVFTQLISIAAPIAIILILLLSDIRKPEMPGPGRSEINISVGSVDKLPVISDNEEPAKISNKKEGEDITFLEVKPVKQSEEKEHGFNLKIPVSLSDVIKPPESINSISPPEIVTSNFKWDPFYEKDILVSEPVMAGVNVQVDEGSFRPESKLKINKFSLGISLSEKNTWLINQETFDGLDRQKLNTTKAKFLNDVGIILRYTHSERWSFEGSCFLFSKTGQSYMQYLNGIYNSKSYELKYFSFEFSARHTFHRSLNVNKVNFYTIAGAYVSHLSSAYKRIDNTLYNIAADFDPVDYGILFGYEAEIDLFSRFSVTPGFRIKLGIPNIFADQQGIPDELHSTRNASLEFRLNLILPISNH